MSRTLSIGLALLVGTAGCTQATTPSYAPISRTPAPLPSGSSALTLNVAPPAPFGPGPNWACPEATTATLRVMLEGDVVAFETDTGERIDLVWPRGFSARLVAGRAEIVAPDGTVVGREGEPLDSGMLSGSGSTTGAEPGFDICGVKGVYYPPAQ